MQDDLKCKTHSCHSGFCFVRSGLWFFIIGLILGFGVLIHYLLGSAYNNSQYFLSNITLWFGSPLTLSVGYLQIGGLGMALLGVLYLLISKCCDTTNGTLGNTAHCSSHKCTDLILCKIGLIALIITGYLGYYVIDYFWPGFYYAPIMAGKNLWLALQGLSILIYLIGFIIATSCIVKCKHHVCCANANART